MSADAEPMLAALRAVAVQRATLAGDPERRARVEAVKAYQQRRFERSHALLFRDARYAPAARYFLDELYGPADFTERDAQFERVVPALVRLMPAEIVGTVRRLAELHALSEALDATMAESLHGVAIDAPAYVAAWQATGRAGDRETQIALMAAVGAALDRYTRNPLLRNALRMMRGPARAAGLASLQGFLERGFEAFRAMRGASDFLAGVSARERELAAALFDPRAAAVAGRSDASTEETSDAPNDATSDAALANVLRQLP